MFVGSFSDYLKLYGVCSLAHVFFLCLMYVCIIALRAFNQAASAVENTEMQFTVCSILQSQYYDKPV